MVLIPAGEFQMGSAVGPLDDRADEAPQHPVKLQAYYIDKLPVTNRQYYNFVISSGYKPEGGWQKYYEPATADLPVRGVSFADASAYARWAGKRLPTEAEWEKAARGTDARTYPWGEEWSSEILPRTDNFYGLVGSPKIASPYGVLAMCGILWQWTASSYAAYPFNPKAAGDKKVLRGGCFSNGRNIVRCANRYAEQPGVALNTFTFRCAKDA
jgi:formylglycine-generating enzyme required for sulfatase activity